MSKSSLSLNISRVKTSETIDFVDNLAVEEPLEIRLQLHTAEGEKEIPVSVTMRTPGHDTQLALGFLFTEAIIQQRQSVVSVFHKETLPGVMDENIIIVRCAPHFQPELDNLKRNFYTTSSCGVCGKASIDAIKTKSQFAGTTAGIKAEKDILFSLPAKLNEQQQLFHSTGGLHASALFDVSGNIIALFEDVGRHNALDKLIGAAFLENKLPLAEHILLLSGRASFELIQKAAMAGISIVAAIGAPSSLAVQLAKESGIKLIGFLKEDRYNLYCE